jgi:hypothetical protein
MTGATANMTQQQRDQLNSRLTDQFNSDFNRSLNATFTDPQMRARYDQLNRQYMGYAAFNEPSIQRQLNLTPQQMQQVRQFAAQWRQQLAQYNNNGAGTVSNLTPQQWQQVYAQYWSQLNGVLTPQQQQTWAQLTGQQYTFPSTLYISRDNGEDGSLGVTRGTAYGPPGRQIAPQGSTNQPTTNQPGAAGTQTTPQGSNANAGNGTTKR